MIEVICIRRFLSPEDGSPIDVEWRRPAPNEVAWRCDWCIRAAGRPDERGHAYGEDGVQALLLAMSLVRMRLEDMGARWLEGARGLGLPQASDTSIVPEAA